MNRGRISISVFLCFLVMMFLVVSGCSKSDDPAYNISGAVTGATGVTINLTGAATATTTTDASGNYSFTGRANGTYTVTPVKTGYIFNPVSLVASVSGASVTGHDFVATATGASTFYSISGTVSGAASSGVTITLSGANTGSVVTGVGGTYSISGLVPGSYTVTPSLTGFTFSPTSTAVTITDANSTGNNFVATAIPVAHSISGTVSGATLAGVTITVTGTATATNTTATDGSYTVTGLYDGGYTVTPSKTGYTFAPTSTAVTMSGANITGKNFVATANAAPTYTISGAVSGDVLSSVTITLSGAGTASTTTNTSGNYSFSGLVDGSYTVTPSLTGYTFSPTSSAANVSGAAITGKNFVATAIPTAWSQADLTGTWRVNMLRTGTKTGWIRGRLSIDGAGNASCLSTVNSIDASGCPTSMDWKMTINASGVITETGADSAENGHMTMTSNKNFVAATGTTGNPSYQLATMQKEVTGTVYSNADVQNKSFVYHALDVGSNNGWLYGDGTTNASGATTLGSYTTSWGDDGQKNELNGTFVVDGNGNVTLLGNSFFHGFMSDDKKTIVAAYPGGDSVASCYIIQVTGKTYTAGPLPAGTSVAHMLAVGSTPAPFWLHFTSTVASGGVITLSDWVSSNSGITNPGTTKHGSISALGTVTVAEDPSFHGQVSDDGKFTVATQTITSGAYALQVTTQ